MKNFIFILLSIIAVPGIYAQQYEAGTTTALWKNPTVADFQKAKACGINYVEVALNQCYRGVPEEEQVPRMKALKAMIDSAGIKVWSMHLPFSRTLDISVLDDEAREKNIRVIARMIEFSAPFGPSRLVLHASSEPIADSIRQQRLLNASHSVAILKECADKIGAQLCVENLPRTCLGNTPEELLKIIEATPGVGICFDTNHYFKGTTEHFMQTAGRHIATIHASDFDLENECHWLPTQGEIAWGTFMYDLEKNGYKGVFMYEATKDHDNKDGKLTSEQIAESFKKIKEMYKTKE